MKTMKPLPKRVFNSPLIRYANFKDGSHINLIRLKIPYKNGMSYAIHETTNSPSCSHGLFKTYKEARNKFDSMVKIASVFSPVVDEADTKNLVEEKVHLVDKKEFLDWYFSDKEEILDFAKQLIFDLAEFDEVKVSAKQLFNEVGYIPAQIVLNDDSDNEYSPKDCELID